MRSAFSRVSGEVTPTAYTSKIEAALQDMTSKINESANQQSRLERLARTLGRDHNSSTAMKRLQMELEQVRGGFRGEGWKWPRRKGARGVERDAV